MFIRPDLRKGTIDVRIKAPKDLVDKLDLISIALGITRQDIVLVALDAYTQEMAYVSKVLADAVDPQRKRNGSRTAEDPR